jgi:hypothetical protein
MARDEVKGTDDLQVTQKEPGFEGRNEPPHSVQIHGTTEFVTTEEFEGMRLAEALDRELELANERLDAAKAHVEELKAQRKTPHVKKGLEKIEELKERGLR